MTKRIIYCRPGDTFEFRFVPTDHERKFKVWDMLARRPKNLYRVWYNRIAPATPAVMFDTSNEAWR